MRQENSSRANIVDAAYDAAFDPSRWPTFLKLMSQEVQAEAGCIFLHDFDAQPAKTSAADFSLAVLAGFDAGAWAAYEAHYHLVNVWTKREETLPPGLAVSSSMLYPDDHLPRTEFGADWLKPQDFFYALGGVVDRQGSVALKMSFVRPRSVGPFDDTALAKWQTMMPHVQRAADLHKRLRQSEQRASDAYGALSLLATGVVFISEGRVSFINEAAERILANGRGLLLDQRRQLVAIDPTVQQDLNRLIRLAANPEDMPGSAARERRSLRVSGSRGAMSISVTTVPAANERPVPSRTVAVFLDVIESRQGDLVGALVREYGLTPAEAALTADLVGGTSLRIHAERRGVSLNTVRSQLKAAMHKAGARRQADLVRMVLTGPAMPSPLRR